MCWNNTKRRIWSLKHLTLGIHNSSGTTLGTLILITAGDSIVIEKDETDTIASSGNAVGSAVSSPR